MHGGCHGEQNTNKTSLWGSSVQELCSPKAGGCVWPLTREQPPGIYAGLPVTFTFTFPNFHKPFPVFPSKREVQDETMTILLHTCPTGVNKPMGTWSPRQTKNPV